MIFEGIYRTLLGVVKIGIFDRCMKTIFLSLEPQNWIVLHGVVFPYMYYCFCYAQFDFSMQFNGSAMQTHSRQCTDFSHSIKSPEHMPHLLLRLLVYANPIIRSIKLYHKMDIAEKKSILVKCPMITRLNQSQGLCSTIGESFWQSN